MIKNQRKNLSIRECRNTVLQQNNVKYIIKQTQQYMTNLTKKLAGIPAFDNSVNPDDCVDRLVAHRITSKFHIEDSTRAAILRAEAFTVYKEYDSTLRTSIDVWSNPALLAARRNLREWFEGFSVDLAVARYKVSPGETFISSGGEVSILSKLFNVRHWTTTVNCLDLTCVFIYNNASFKRAARQHILAQNITRRERRKIHLRFKNSPDRGFRVFSYLLTQYVLTIVDGARAAVVPKSNSVSRFINIEAMFAVIVQRAIADKFLRVLKHNGNDLGVKRHGLNRGRNDYLCRATPGFLGLGGTSAQALHSRMISNDRYSTIDFSRASDSVTVAAVCSLFPKQVWKSLLQTRSHFVAIDEELVAPLKLSSMGNGFTFEVMTALLYAIGRTFTDDVRVYGDDVIIPNEYADQFVSACALIDFRVNESKTFINSFFRESCGAFYSDHHGYITSFDFGQVLSMSDCIITCNKLTIVLEKNQVSQPLYHDLMQTRDSIAALIHASRKGPLPSGLYMQRQNMAMYVFDEGFVKKQRRSKELSILRQHYIEKNEDYFKACQIARSNQALIYVPFFVPELSKHVFSNARGYQTLLPALYSGKRLKALVKGKGKWRDLPAFVDQDGTITLLSSIISAQKSWVDRLNGVILNHEGAVTHYNEGKPF